MCDGGEGIRAQPVWLQSQDPWYCSPLPPSSGMLSSTLLTVEWFKTRRCPQFGSCLCILFWTPDCVQKPQLMGHGTFFFPLAAETGKSYSHDIHRRKMGWLSLSGHVHSWDSTPELFQARRGAASLSGQSRRVPSQLSSERLFSHAQTQFPYLCLQRWSVMPFCVVVTRKWNNMFEYPAYCLLQVELCASHPNEVARPMGDLGIYI